MIAPAARAGRGWGDRHLSSLLPPSVSLSQLRLWQNDTWGKERFRWRATRWRNIQWHGIERYFGNSWNFSANKIPYSVVFFWHIYVTLKQSGNPTGRSFFSFAFCLWTGNQSDLFPSPLFFGEKSRSFSGCSEMARSYLFPVTRVHYSF